jgi:hypothetical protein
VDSRSFKDLRLDRRWHVNQTADKKKATWPNENSELGSGLERERERDVVTKNRI